jgi:hypothetical protein
LQANVNTIIRHLELLSKRFDGARIVVCPENNLAWEASWLATAIEERKWSHVCVMREDDFKWGVRTTNSLKKFLARSYGELLDRHRVRFADTFITVSHAEEPHVLREDIMRQHYNYCRIIQTSGVDPHRAPVEKYGGKQGYGFDDHTLCAQLDYLAYLKFKRSPKQYAKWIQ